MVFYGILRRMRNQDDFFDPCSNNLVDDVLNHRFVDDRQHLFRDCFSGWQHMHAQACYRNDCFQINHYFFHLKMVDEL